jgi:hypothetical protein
MVIWSRKEKTMSIIKDTFFGGAEKDAAKQQQYHLEQGQDLIREGVAQGREDINRLYPQAQNMTAQGFQGAMDVFNQSIPQQMQAFQQGNMGAQNALLAGAPQFQNAILGGPVDYSQMQAQKLNMPQMNYQMPDFFAQPTQPNVQELTANQPMQFPQGLSGMLSMYGSNGRMGGGMNTGPLSIGGGFRDFSQRGNIRER